MKRYNLIVCFFFAVIMITACQSQDAKTPPSSVASQPKPVFHQIKTHILQSESFKENIDWLSDTEILTVKDENGSTALYITDLVDGTSKKIYELSAPYVQSIVSPDRDKILIHSAPSTYSALITIIDRNGKEIVREEVPSYEMSVEWNAFNTDKLLITSFAEDWSYEVNELDLTDTEMEAIEIEQPFFKWNSEVSVLYQDWNDEELSVSAPLVSENLLDRKRQIIDPWSIHFNRFREFLLSVHESGEADDSFSFQLFNEEGEVLSQFNMILLSRYSDWFIPYYDMIEEKKELIIFKANDNGSFDSYSGAFSLVKWDVIKGNESIVYEDLPLEEIQCSPQGDYCLYGNRLEKVINMREPVVLQLIQEEG
ncbi:hypothetical protein LCM10_07445 [Rossellomorea aquimaris]|uniref:YqgU-like beta propeller domain-containing protein n=1 Tax=Rossellomorea aquimaris TaxID=189382 RepID=UPI001CD5D194|nr:hypothetical protein [Rossellomorea aquimaris]MCA1054819.1 hypothetical protein [Rossellomorea aquimaris]